MICIGLLFVTTSQKECYAQSADSLLISQTSHDTLDSEIYASALNQLSDSLITVAKHYIGTKYRKGGNGPDKFDCSGFTSFVFKKFGYNLSRTSTGQAKDGKEVNISDFNNLRKGDIVIFGSRGNSKRVGHVGIFIELDTTSNSFSFIHASTHNGVIVSQVKEPYYSTRFLGGRRILLASEQIAEQNEVSTLSSKENSNESEENVVYHKIKSGDTLYSIAKRYKTTITTLCNLNNLKSSTILKIGRKIRVK